VFDLTPIGPVELARVLCAFLRACTAEVDCWTLVDKLKQVPARFALSADRVQNVFARFSSEIGWEANVISIDISQAFLAGTSAFKR